MFKKKKEGNKSNGDNKKELANMVSPSFRFTILYSLFEGCINHILVTGFGRKLKFYDPFISIKFYNETFPKLWI